ncbi:MAG: dethiobiotin synthase [Endozoicomonadaceae bacterium]|nr:dethiobiotin synthase [Endozoicomonadaceae bacterium]
MQKLSLFITGTNTNSGKTIISCGLLEKFKAYNLSTVALKPIASGSLLTDQGLRNTDALALQHAMSTSLPYTAVNPITFEPPIAPHIAAQQHQVNLSIDHIIQHCQTGLNTSADVLLIEGAGGWRLPLSDRDSIFFSAFPQQLKMSVILVVGLTLGCLNHAQLTVEAILSDQVSIAGWIANQIDPNMSHIQDNLTWLKQQMPGHYLGYVPHLTASISPKTVAKYLQIDAILNPSIR